ncbi:lysine-specific demethylase 5B-like isoform X2 [Hemiscyllium ocellatum]|uniref:lysine-specific demethylase 5B-like isoform X2 n=1 Tax=Hemiscyllium ocellatum TaxID=170820 RepID=UPI002965F25E|nr:lysine-specific demethylase 5B-like isoform X2 [Hemiscyllium ocellatum]
MNPAVEFIPPPECPVFEPTPEEFADPFRFISKIRPIAEKTGICKVRPPQNWQPPFACDVDKLHFTPRIQRLNELEAQTRVKLNFLDQIAKFWELQGSTLKIPHVERKILDLFLLNKLVAEEGGFEIVCKERRWSKIAHKMAYPPGKALGSLLRSHYERILYPYNLFQSGASLLCVQKPSLINDEKDQEYKPHDIVQRQSVHSSEMSMPARRAKRMRSEMGCVKSEASEIMEVHAHDLRPKTRSGSMKCESEKYNMHGMKKEGNENRATDSERARPIRNNRNMTTSNIVDLYVCLICGQGNEEDRLLLCDGCDDSYHTFCLIPPLQDVPKGDWRCPKCLAQECSKPQEAFGFEQAPRDYTLRAFGEMADAFKSDYFNMPVHMVPTELVEKEFWRLVSTIEEDVTVEYGADIASKEFGSGFPIKNGKIKLRPDEQEYFDSGWNLNNMPVLEPSVLTHVSADICGMKLPWLYVGMCFSSFCWHIEDHWSYSINYLHWGEPKTWYGAPAYVAEQLESVMKRLAPELFESQPDLLHQLVTIMNPNTLMAHGVPVYRTNQCAGEFVITFPRAYHSGFNQGFNFAEAVNFCTMDWLPMGRQCVEHYRLLNRYCVFSHDEMICKMASKSKDLDVVLASAVYKDMVIMIEEEKKLREAVRKMGVIESVRENFELLPDDERQCAKCKTTCFLSAISCVCKSNQLVCLYHAKELCLCPPHRCHLRYRYALDDLYPILSALKLHVATYDEWSSKVTDALEAKDNEKKSLSDLKSMVEEAEKKNFPENDLLKQLKEAILEAEKCASVAQQLLNNKRQTRYRSGGGKSQNRLTVAELQAFVKQLYALPCIIDQAPLLKDLLNSVEDFQQRSEKAVSDERPNTSELQQLMDLSFGFDIELPQLQHLREHLEQAKWLDEVQLAYATSDSFSLDEMRQLIDSGVGLMPHQAVEKAMAQLQELLTVSEQLEEKAHNLLKTRPPHSLTTLSAALEEGEAIPAYLPHVFALKEAMEKAQIWLQEVDVFQNSDEHPPVETLVELITHGRTIPVRLDPLPQLESLLADVETWRDSAAKTFLRKTSTCSLYEVLCPRSDICATGLKNKTKKSKDTLQNGKRKVPKLQSVASFNEARLKEMESFRSIQTANSMKFLSDMDCMVCVCQKAATGSMLQCELCKDWFHSSCVLMVNAHHGELPWLCPLCLRSEKPSFEQILPLLTTVQKIPVRLPEGEALSYVFERAMNWQHRTKQLLSRDELRLAQITSQVAIQAWQGMTKQMAATELEKRVADGNLQVNSGNESELITAVCNTNPFEKEKIVGIRPPWQTCIPAQGLCLSDDVRSQLDELMMEALLLQVSLPEMQHIYQIFCAAQYSVVEDHQPRSELLNCKPVEVMQCLAETCTSTTEGEDCCLKPVKKEGNCEKKKRRLEKDGSLGEKREKLKKLNNPKKRNVKLNQERTKNLSLVRIEAEKYLEFLQPHEALSVIMEPPYSEPEDSEDEDAICPAESCQQPEGDEVDWVQCDGSCNQWFHQICVGVSSETAEKEDYICINCTVKDQNNRKQNGQG